MSLVLDTGGEKLSAEAIENYKLAFQAAFESVKN
jgi:hypothetical protein